MHFMVDGDCGMGEDCHCICSQHHHSNEINFNNCTQNLCCDYSLVYLKTDPNTILTETKRAPNALQILLFTVHNSNLTDSFHTFLATGEYIETSLTCSAKHSRDTLCCYIC